MNISTRIIQKINGITLIALIVKIIILIVILATVFNRVLINKE